MGAVQCGASIIGKRGNHLLFGGFRITYRPPSMHFALKRNQLGLRGVRIQGENLPIPFYAAACLTTVIDGKCPMQARLRCAPRKVNPTPAVMLFEQ